MKAIEINKSLRVPKLVLFFVVISLLAACKGGPFNLIKSGSPHQQYEKKLINAGLDKTALGMAWINKSGQSLQQALAINLPYRERGYFSAEKPEAVAFKFNVTKGQKINVELSKKPIEAFQIYFDIWERQDNQEFKLIVAADTLGNPVQLDVDKTGELILRLQPELLGGGEYTLSVNVGPSLAFPLKKASRSQIQSLYGVGRDDGARRHEGIDIFGPFRTPVLAAAPGTVTRVNTNNLGGKVVWMRPDNKDFNLYYAHLDEQTVTDGQRVSIGDTLGRMGNTGNARTTPPHLHFGIYTNGGTVDPLPFVNPEIADLPKINVATERLKKSMRTKVGTTIGGQKIQSGTIVQVDAGSGNNYRVALPNGLTGYVAGSALQSTSSPLRKYKLKDELKVYDHPDTTAAVKLNMKTGKTVSVLGSFGNYQFIVADDDVSGWVLLAK